MKNERRSGGIQWAKLLRNCIESTITTHAHSASATHSTHCGICNEMNHYFLQKNEDENKCFFDPISIVHIEFYYISIYFQV